MIGGGDAASTGAARGRRMSLVAELKRRKVFKVGAAYLVVAWLAVQAASIGFPAFDAPPWALRVFILIALLGFPITLVMAWMFDATSDGLRLDTAANGSKRVFAGAVVLVVLALGWYFYGQPAFRRGDAVTPPAANTAGTPAPSASEQSIAVLPFENLSDDKANAYFAEGIQDEILTRLAKISALKVISRTSTQHYASSPGNLPAIARQLGVANILEGSVQKAGNSVHINVQLIHAATDAHLWAESYDRQLDNIFGVEGEVAQTIAESMNAKLSGTEVAQVTALPTSNPAAYDAYLHGIAADRTVFGSVTGLKAASGFYAQAARRDPKFALAWARGSIDDGLLYAQALDRSAERLGAARHGADVAMQLAPESPEAWLAKGFFLYHTRDFDGARDAFAQADRRLPNNPQIFAAQGYLERRAGRFDQAIALLTRSLDRDPQNVNNIATLADFLNALGRPQAALAWVDRALTFNPGDPAILAQKGQFLLAEGDLDGAGRVFAALPANADDVFLTQSQVAYLFARRDWAAVVHLMQGQMSAPDFVLNGWNAANYASLGWAQRYVGDEKAAQATFAEGRRRIAALDASAGDNGYLAAQLALIDAGRGDADGAEREGRLAVQRAGNDRLNALGMEVNLAYAEVLSGKKEQALSTLARLVDGPVPVAYGDLKLSKAWDELRSDPRFVKLLARSEARMKAQDGSTP